MINDWIPVTEALPQDNSRVLAKSQEGVQICRFIENIEHDGGFAYCFYNYKANAVNTTHWKYEDN